MTAIWVDTDFGFDDLWALLLLRHFGRQVAGVSLVAGNTALPQVVANAMGAKEAYGFDWPVWQGATKPLRRRQETAERILGARGMVSRGRHLPEPVGDAPPEDALNALRHWLETCDDTRRVVLALGPLTNIALFLRKFPALAGQIERLVWMGSSTGAGNHTPFAEFNAFADADALASVLEAGLNVDIVDLCFCRQMTFGPKDLPEADELTRDLLGGYLDIALSRGRSRMAIYDPLAALAVAAPDTITFAPCYIDVSTGVDERYGATKFVSAVNAPTRVAAAANADLSRLCLDALKREAVHGPRQ